MKWVLTCAVLVVMTASCALPGMQPNGTLTREQAATLGSLQLVDDYPLYTMRYTASYSGRAGPAAAPRSVAALDFPAQGTCQAQWGCSLFAALGDEKDRLLGRNFDWEFSPAVLLFTYPEDGYASVSMVDIAYLGFADDRSRNLIDLSLEGRKALLDAPFLPFDGMNEKGLAVGMAAVEAGNMPQDPHKKTIGELEAIREILDHAATVDEAVKILESYNIDMGNVPIHYMIASASGESALVEFYEGKMVVFRNKSAWHTATNFLLASVNGHPQGECWRYDRMSRRLGELQGQISAPDAVSLLGDVSQDSTQWSIVYHVTSGDLEVVMGRGYSEPVRSFHLEPMAR
jgi:linear amide C-N hydrolase (choloylglycine hydrolase family)